MIEPRARPPYEPRSAAEFDAVVPPVPHAGLHADYVALRSPLRLHDDEGDEDPHALPDAAEMSDTQLTDAVYRLHEDARTYPSFPWVTVDEIVGPLAPEDLWIIAGRTGGGKSLFLQNAFDGFVNDGRRVLYIGLEQSPKILRAKWSCLRTGTPPKLVLKPRRHEYGTPAHIAARTAVLEDMRDFQGQQDIRERALFAAARFVDRTTLAHWTRGAVAKYGTEIVIVDHIDRIHHGDGRNSFHELSETVRLAKELAVELQIRMLVASQVGRPSDKLERFTPPSLHELRGAGTKEEEADEVLTVYQPMRTDLPAKQLAAKMQAVRLGQIQDSEIIQPNVMAVRELKNRIDGAVRGRTALLDVVKGRLTDQPVRGFGGRLNV
jgi:KaiC/GvpD/RAD55 family RecA-like ATPase